MDNVKFVKEYKETVNRIFILAEKARREGLLASVLGIQAGINPRLLKVIINSYVNIDVEETMKQYNSRK